MHSGGSKGARATSKGSGLGRGLASGQGQGLVSGSVSEEYTRQGLSEMDYHNYHYHNNQYHNNNNNNNNNNNHNHNGGSYAYNITHPHPQYMLGTNSAAGYHTYPPTQASSGPPYNPPQSNMGQSNMTQSNMTSSPGYYTYPQAYGNNAYQSYGNASNPSPHVTQVTDPPISPYIYPSLPLVLLIPR